jgi:hypothetical protein
MKRGAAPISESLAPYHNIKWHHNLEDLDMKDEPNHMFQIVPFYGTEAQTSESLVTYHRTTWCHNLEDLDLKDAPNHMFEIVSFSQI